MDTNNAAEAARLAVATAEFWWEVEAALWASISDDPSAAMKDLMESLAEIEGVEFDSPQAMVDRIGNLKIEIFSNEHAPPHFHVKAPDVDACFRVSDGTFMYGQISSKQQKLVADFFAGNKRRLVAFWNNTRPDGCPVGFVWEDPEGPNGIHAVMPARSMAAPDRSEANKIRERQREARETRQSERGSGGFRR